LCSILTCDVTGLVGFSLTGSGQLMLGKVIRQKDDGVDETGI